MSVFTSNAAMRYITSIGNALFTFSVPSTAHTHLHVYADNTGEDLIVIVSPGNTSLPVYIPGGAFFVRSNQTQSFTFTASLDNRYPFKQLVVPKTSISNRQAMSVTASYTPVSGNVGTNTFQCDTRLACVSDSMQPVWAHCTYDTSLGFGLYNGESTLNMVPRTLEATVLVPVAVYWVVSVNTDYIITLKNPDGSTPTMISGAYDILGSSPYTPANGGQQYVAAFPYATGINHRMKQITSNTATTISITSGFASGFDVAANQECVIYEVRYCTFNGAYTATWTPGTILVADEMPGTYGPNMAQWFGTTPPIGQYGPLIRTFTTPITPGSAPIPQYPLMYPLDGGEDGSSASDNRIDSAALQVGSGTTVGVQPSMILGRPIGNVFVAAGFGDSILYGVNGAYATGRLSAIHLAIIAGGGSLWNAGVVGETIGVGGWLTNSSLRRQMLSLTNIPSVGPIIWAYGRNDLSYASTPASTVASSIATAMAMYPGVRNVQTTVTPITTSTDSWATQANQTADSTNTQRVLFNGVVTSNSIPGQSGYVDWASIYQMPNSKWPNYGTADGIHPADSLIHARYNQLSLSMIFGRSGN